MSSSTWIDCAAQMAALPDPSRLERVALDTEFLRHSTYRPQPCLVQLCCDDGVFLLDIQVLAVLTVFREWMQQARPQLWLMHAAFEDLEVLETLDVPLQGPLWDTQLAASFCGQGFQPGLQNLLQEVLGEHVDKSATRTDWSQRPLSDAQLQYAAQDVRHLQALQCRQEQQMRERGQSEWFAAESAQLRRAVHGDDMQQYLRLRAAWSLSPDRQALLMHLTAWREGLARQRNRPRKRICPDELLIAIAERAPLDLRALKGLCGRQQARLPADDLQAIIRQIESWRGTALPESFVVIPRPLPSAARNLMKAARAGLQRIAQDHDLPAATLASRQQLEALIWYHLEPGSSARPACLQGWREPLLEPLLSELELADPA